MLESIAIALIIVWALGLIASYSLGGFLHLLLIAAIVMILVRATERRRMY